MLQVAFSVLLVLHSLIFGVVGDGDSLVSALPAGKGIYDLEQDDVEKMESPTRKDETQDRDKKMTGFATAVGNGIFWVLPFVMYFVPITLVGFSLYENGNLTEDFRRYGAPFNYIWWSSLWYPCCVGRAIVSMSALLAIPLCQPF